MDPRKRWLRLGILIAVGCLVFALTGAVAPGAVQTVTSEDVVRILLFLQTGRMIRQPEPQQSTQSTQSTVELAKPEPTGNTEPSVQQPVLSPDAVQVYNQTDAAVEVAALWEMPMQWDLSGTEPAVLLLHTHGSESYENTEQYIPVGSYRTLQSEYNVVSVGDRVAQKLEEAGISVLHDRTLHDQPSYNSSYSNARKAIRGYLEQYPSIQLVLDLHRDAAVNAGGEQIHPTAETPRGTAAQLMLVIGTDTGGQTHPRWKQNLALGVRLQAALESLCPGLCRPINLRTQRFNQDLSTGALLVEVGAAGNTRQQALLAADYLAEALICLADSAR